MRCAEIKTKLKGEWSDKNKKNETSKKHRDGRLKAIGEAIVAIRQIRGKRYYADILDTTEWFESVSELRKNKPHAIIVA